MARSMFPSRHQPRNKSHPTMAISTPKTPETLPAAAEALSECHGQKLLDLGQTLWAMFSNTAIKFPDRDAIVSMWQTHDPPHDSLNGVPPSQDSTPSKPQYLRWSYKDLHQRSEVLAAWLESRGCQPQTRFAAFLWNSVEWGLFFWVSARLGMAYAPLDPRAVASDGDFFVKAIGPAVVVAQDADAAAALEKKMSRSHEGSIIRIQCSGEQVSGWTLLSQIWETSTASSLDPGNEMAGPASQGANSSSPEDVALVIFTSGTTSNPKGCVHTHSNLVAQTNQYDPNPDPSVPDRWLVHTPVSHIFAVNNGIRSWRLGDAVVFASKAFDVQSTLRALIDEQVTIMSAVPTLVKALLANPLFPGKQALSLSLVTIGGTLIGPADIRLCKDGLGARHAVQAFGMSEGAPVISWTRPDPLLNYHDGYHPGVGKTLPGANIRICVPGTRDVVARNEVGELHIGGPPVISQYLGGVGTDSIYTDKVGNWLATGDQARMDDDGVVYIIGRYKDLIIRGGENISPARLEAAIGEIPGVLAQVVGVPDKFAGQVPVAVVKMPETVSKKDVMAKCRELGPMFALSGVYLLSDLGMEAFPLTSIGKVKKEVLKKAILDLRSPNTTAEPRPENGCLVAEKVMPTVDTILAKKPIKTNGSANGVKDTLADRLALLWKELIGEVPLPDDSISLFADSITLLRYCDRVLTSLGQRLHLQDFKDNDTVAKLAAVLEERSRATASFQIPGLSEGTTSHNMINLLTNGATRKPGQNTAYKIRDGTVSREIDLYRTAAQAVTEAGFQPGDIEDVLRIKDSFHSLAIGAAPQSNQDRMIFRVLGDVGVAQVRRGLEVGLASRPILRTILAQLSDDTPFHVILRPGQRLLDSVIQEIETTDDDGLDKINQSASNPPYPFMAWFQIIMVKQTGEIFLSATYNRSVFDSRSILPWHLDLARFIERPTAAVPPMTPFKMFAELIHLYQSSVPAQMAVEHSVARLRGISRLTDAFWPIQRAPGWMISDDSGHPLVEERALARKDVWKGEWDEARAEEFRFARMGRLLPLYGLDNLLAKLKVVNVALVMKAAIALFNVLRTGAQHAVFNSLQAGRSWPFLPPWMEKGLMLPPPISIDGPTSEWTLELCEVVRRGETVAELLLRMRNEQELLEKHAHAPWFQVLDGLGDEAEAAVDASLRQSFSWELGNGMPKGGLAWNAFMTDRLYIFFSASWDTAQMNVGEVEEHCETVASILRRLVAEENLDRKVVDVFSL
ncbi:hypothetical protein B0H63DRAFT_530207 [Podospora didyma]|uniref:Carrier domain-containing protein n=1 Tax=Podospora didyma TaxID=330526 RepID=A0AAE0P3S5_9PEZI|nr:hypothetical protein B0H63DRAFT_540073 [Podospora didyma]KAK3392761.1 hypothetical protein B0H63DRAFT_530207 [Podospora didyma]